MCLSENLSARLKVLLSGGNVEIRESGSRISPVAPVNWEIRGAPEKPLLHLWAENCNLTRRVVSISDSPAGALVLVVERFGRARPERLEIAKLLYSRNAKEISREDFCEQLRRILAERFPDEELESLSVANDLEHSLSGVYARGILHQGLKSSALLAIRDNESPGALESSLTYGLLWMDRAKHSAKRANLSSLRLIVPKGQSIVLANRLRALDPRVSLQVYELDAVNETLEPVDLLANGNQETWLVARRTIQLLLERAHSALDPIMAVAPEAIQAHTSVQKQEVVLRYLGVPFVRWHEGRVFFGTGSTWEELGRTNHSSLEQLIKNLQTFRSPHPSNVRHPLYRSHAERWLQALVRQDVQRIDITLDPQFVYEQVFAPVAGHTGVLDLLCVTRNGRLAILELKTSENPDLPLQAVDYWSRIRWFQKQEQFPNYGYFPGIEILPAPPVVYLIAPALRFHPTTDTLLRYVSPEIDVVRVGLTEDWRRGLRVMFRQ